MWKIKEWFLHYKEAIRVSLLALFRWTLLAVCTGVLCGGIGTLFHLAVEWVTEQRAEQVAEIQSRIMDDYNESCIGKTMQVLCEGFDPDEESYYGRTYADSPDIDGKVLFTAVNTLPTPGDFVHVHITDCINCDLMGELVEGGHTS